MANRSTSETVRASTVNGATATADSVSSPLDQISSSQIALTVAEAARLPELNAVRNQADSDSLVLRVVPNDSTSVAKPQIVATADKSKQDIKTYVTVAGDTVSSVATKFGVTSNSIKWSNGLTGDSLAIGAKLLIPPVNGIVYTVKAGDTPATLATKYGADESQIIAYNDAEINGLAVGEQIIIPNGTAPTPSYSYASYYSGLAWGTAPVYSNNGYDYGYCTWYVANRRAAMGNPVPSNLGNAYSWYIGAQFAGLPTGSTPAPGAVMVDAPGDHVMVVEVVNPDGSFWISEMNDYGQISMTDSRGYGGWGRIDYRLIPADAAGRYKFIY
ncbi:MAG TPA: LysM peptidoglycan-binding domain-containing protein [Candidatus Binatia bacterium]|nr:LysM peptidoglycan-binding domain-containing protein [Candidatus Binatia bacterium]